MFVGRLNFDFCPRSAGCCRRSSTKSVPLQAANFLLAWRLASGLVKTSSSSITFMCRDRLGTPTWVGSNSFMMAPKTKSKARIKLSFVKGIRLDMTMFLPCFPLVVGVGLIFFLLVLATTSDRSVQQAADMARMKKGSGKE